MSLKKLLDEKKVFKLICAAGNEDLEQIKKLVSVYAKAGCKFFDVAADEKVILAAKEAINSTIEPSSQKDYHICISIGTSNDPHTRKAFINQGTCINCGSCYQACPQKAIKTDIGYSVSKIKCIGCGTCSTVCSSNSVFYQPQKKILSQILTPLTKSYISAIELHANDDNDLEAIEIWDDLNQGFEGILSLCIGRKHLSDEKLTAKIQELISTRPPYSTIIQADGNPMTGGEDTYSSTLQSVACAQIVQEVKIPVYILLSGGTNSKTAELAKLCNVNYSGIAVGSYARRIVKSYIEEDGSQNFEQAVKVAQELIEKNL